MEIKELNKSLLVNKNLYYKDFLTVQDLQAYLSIGKNKALEIMQSKGYLIGKSYVIDKDKIKETMQEFTQEEKSKYKKIDRLII